MSRMPLPHWYQPDPDRRSNRHARRAAQESEPEAYDRYLLHARWKGQAEGLVCGLLLAGFVAVLWANW